jgi:AcrR family transcriptional regulator
MNGDEVQVPPVKTPSMRRPLGQVRRGLIAAGMAMARAGGPDSVVLREAARQVGVAPNAAYRHFNDRDALLNAVCVEAMQQLAHRMEIEAARVSHRYGTKQGAVARLTAIGVSYLDFAITEPGLFETAFAVPRHLDHMGGDAALEAGGRTPFQILAAVLDELVTAGVLPQERRAGAEYTVWSAVHGMAMLINQGPLRQLPPSDTTRLIDLLFAFIGRGL